VRHQPGAAAARHHILLEDLQRIHPATSM
jgi:hypothetical protein